MAQAGEGDEQLAVGSEYRAHQHRTLIVRGAERLLVFSARLWVAGQGEGVYVSFKRHVMGKSTHTLKMDSGGNKSIKLAGAYWVVL